MKVKRELDNRKRRIALQILLLVILLCYIFPWFSIDLPEDSGLSFSGYNMLLGKRWEDVRYKGVKMGDAVNDEEVISEIGQEELDQMKNAGLLDPSFFGIAAFALILISGALTFRKVRSCFIIATVLVFISFVINFAVFALCADELISFSETVLTDFADTTQNAYDYTSFFLPLYVIAAAYVASIITGIASSIGRYKPVEHAAGT